MAKKEAEKKTKEKKPLTKSTKSSILMIVLAIIVTVVFGGIMYFSFRYISHLNLRQNENGPEPDKSVGMNAGDMKYPEEIYDIPDYSEFITLGEYKNLSYEFTNFDSKTYASKKDQIIDHLLAQVLSNTTFSGYSETEYNDAYAIADNNVQAFADAYGMEKLDYLTKYYGFETLEDYEKHLKNTTIDYLKVKMTITQIAISEKMELTDNDLDLAKEQLMKENGIETEEDFQKMFTQTDIQFYAIRAKVYDWLYQNSEIIDNSTDTDATAETPTDNSTETSADGDTEASTEDATNEGNE